MSSFYEIGVLEHLGEKNQLIKLGRLIDGSRFAEILQGIHKLDGPTGYVPIKMFKCLLLQSWHSLSDAKLEESLRVRLDFLKFTGFSLGDRLPDETTFCRFRNKLISQGKFERLFSEVNRQLEELGLKVKSAEIAIVDATIITSNARPRKIMESSDNENYTTKLSSDPDAKWLKKGKKYYFGYRGYARSDDEGFIEKAHVTPANLPETKELETMTDGLSEGVRVQADKGFFSAANKEMLRSKKLKNGIMYRAFHNKPLKKRMIQFNKLISKTRWRIEQCFGTIKRRFSYHKAQGNCMKFT